MFFMISMISKAANVHLLISQETGGSDALVSPVSKLSRF